MALTPPPLVQWEKRNIAQEIPVWDADVCVQCGKCVLVCPHAVIRSKVYDEAELATARKPLKSLMPRITTGKG
jgi:pyruvate-ferredoxin/flavodoxin oxidoreductase